MAQTSIHFQAVKGGSEEHNKREKKLDYVHHERSSMNEYWESDTQEARLAFVTANAKAKTGRKMQAKATPIREAVVVIREDTTMSDLQNLAKRLHDRFGMDVFQIAIHKDEGYKKGKDGLKLNLHAHLVADWTDHQTGKSLKLNRQDMAEMQTITAEVLGMERGKSSQKQHLSAIQYKIAAEEQRAESQAKANAINGIVAAVGIHAAKREQETIEAKTKCLDTIRQSLSKDIRSMQSEVNEKDKELSNITKETEIKRSENVRLSEEGKSLLETRYSLTSDISALKAKKEEMGSEAENLANVVQAARSDLSHLNAQKIALSGAILNLNQERDKAQKEAEEAKAQKRAAEAEALGGFMVGGAKKLGNVLGFGKEAKALKELPQQIAAAKAEGRSEAMLEVLKGARMEYKDMSKVTPEKIGRDLAQMGKTTAENATRQLRNLKAENEALTSRNKLLLSIPIIEKALEVLRNFVYHIFATFSTEDKKVLSQVLQGDERRAKTLRDLGEAYGGVVSQGQYWSRWNEAEREMVKIARGENQEQDLGRSQGRRWHL
jgi:hypothetical protein